MVPLVHFMKKNPVYMAGNILKRLFFHIKSWVNPIIYAPIRTKQLFMTA